MTNLLLPEKLQTLERQVSALEAQVQALRQSVLVIDANVDFLQADELGGPTRRELTVATRPVLEFSDPVTAADATPTATVRIGMRLDEVRRVTGRRATLSHFMAKAVSAAASAARGRISASTANMAKPPRSHCGEVTVLRRDWRQGYMFAVSYSFQRSRFLRDESWGARLGFGWSRPRGLRPR